MKNRLIEAATAIDQTGEFIRMEARKHGIRMYMLRGGGAAKTMQTESFTPWIAIEEAKINPLLAVMRDLINQMDDQVSI